MRFLFFFFLRFIFLKSTFKHILTEYYYIQSTETKPFTPKSSLTEMEIPAVTFCARK